MEQDLEYNFRLICMRRVVRLCCKVLDIAVQSRPAEAVLVSYLDGFSTVTAAMRPRRSKSANPVILTGCFRLISFRSIAGCGVSVIGADGVHAGWELNGLAEGIDEMITRWEDVHPH